MAPSPERFGPFVLLREIGRGGMGEVFIARSPWTHAPTVALKRLRADSQIPAFRERFQREARIAVLLVHPNIASALAAGSVRGRPFIASELVVGKDAGQLVAKLKELERSAPLPVAIRICADALEALAFVHRANVGGGAVELVHRDVKPANLLIGYDGVTKLTDFGLAKSLADPSLTDRQHILGTPHYLAPEVIRGLEQTRAADIYSLGAVMYRVLTGSPPHEAPSTAELLNRIVKERPRPIAALRSDLPAWLAALVNRMLEPDPKRRPREARALAAELSRDATNDGLLIPPERIGKWLRELFEREHALELAELARFARFDPSALDADREDPKTEIFAHAPSELSFDTPADPSSGVVGFEDHTDAGSLKDVTDPSFTSRLEAPGATEIGALASPIGVAAGQNARRPLPPPPSDVISDHFASLADDGEAPTTGGGPVVSLPSGRSPRGVTVTLDPYPDEDGISAFLRPRLTPSSDETRFGRFTILGQLGRGGMAVVHAAREEVEGGGTRSCVIKRIAPGLENDPLHREMFAEEARIAAQLDHPNIVKCYESGEVDGVPYICFELVDGISLSELLERPKDAPLPVAVALDVAILVASALEHAHELRGRDGRRLEVVHRDVAPDNVLLSRTGEVKLIDFGISRFRERQHKTQVGLVKGKLTYMAPEQLLGRSVDERADLFGLGLVLAELLGDAPLDPGEGQAQAFVPAHSPDLAPVIAPRCARAETVSPGITELVLRLLARNPTDRPSSAAEVRRELERHRDAVAGLEPPLAAWVAEHVFTEEHATAIERARTASRPVIPAVLPMDPDDTAPDPRAGQRRVVTEPQPAQAAPRVLDVPRGAVALMVILLVVAVGFVVWALKSP